MKSTLSLGPGLPSLRPGVMRRWSPPNQTDPQYLRVEDDGSTFLYTWVLASVIPVPRLNFAVFSSLPLYEGIPVTVTVSVTPAVRRENVEVSIFHNDDNNIPIVDNQRSEGTTETRFAYTPNQSEDLTVSIARPLADSTGAMLSVLHAPVIITPHVEATNFGTIASMGTIELSTEQLHVDGEYDQVSFTVPVDLDDGYFVRQGDPNTHLTSFETPSSELHNYHYCSPRISAPYGESIADIPIAITVKVRMGDGLWSQNFPANIFVTPGKMPVIRRAHLHFFDDGRGNSRATINNNTVEVLTPPNGNYSLVFALLTTFATLSLNISSQMLRAGTAITAPTDLISNSTFASYVTPYDASGFPGATVRALVNLTLGLAPTAAPPVGGVGADTDSPIFDPLSIAYTCLGLLAIGTFSCLFKKHYEEQHRLSRERRGEAQAVAVGAPAELELPNLTGSRGPKM